MDRIKLSLGNQLLLYTLLLSLLPLAIAGFFILRIERQNLIEQAERELSIASQGVGLELTNYVYELQSDVGLLAKLPEIRSMDPAQQSPVLETALPYYERYGQLAIVDLAGEIQLTAREQEAINISHIESFQTATGGEQAWVVAPHLFNDTLVLHMHTPIWSNSEPVPTQVGVLGSPVPFGNIAKLLNKYDQNDPGSVYVLGSDGRILIHANPELRETRPDYSNILFSDRLSMAEPTGVGETGNMTKNGLIESDGVTYVASFTTIESMNWTIVTKRELAEILAPARMIQTIGVGVILTLGIMNVLLLVFVQTRITRPIESLSTAAIELEVGHYSGELPESIYKVEEIGQLGDAFVRMQAAVLDREQKLYDFSESLEHQIEVRTAELQSLNQYLEKEVTEHKLTASELKMSRDELELAVQLNDSFLDRMSHELRTPLNAIIGYAELMEETAADKHDPDTAEDANSIKRAGHHLSTIIDNVLDYSGFQSETIRVEKAPFALDDLVENISYTVGPVADKNGNRMIINNHHPDKYLYSDKVKIRQILIHLMGNAAKFTINGMIVLDIWLGEPHIQKSYFNPNENWLNLQISDTGIGIRSESLESIFRPFRQVSEDYDRPHEGTGLGLVLTHKLVEILDGTIMVESEYGTGSTFTVRIPLEPLPARTTI